MSQSTSLREFHLENLSKGYKMHKFIQRSLANEDGNWKIEFPVEYNNNSFTMSGLVDAVNFVKHELREYKTTSFPVEKCQGAIKQARLQTGTYAEIIKRKYGIFCAPHIIFVNQNTNEIFFENVMSEEECYNAFKIVQARGFRWLARLKKQGISDSWFPIKMLSYRTTIEYLLDYKKYLREHYKKNHDKRLAQGREYWAKYRDEINAHRRERRKQNRDKINAQGREYYKRNKDRILAQQRERYVKNREKYLARNHDQYKKHWEQILAQQREYYKNNRDEINVRRREYATQYRTKNREKIRARDCEYRAKNRDKIHARQREYEKRNHDKILIKRRERDRKNRDKINARQREWYNKNRDKYLAHQRAYRAKRRLANKFFDLNCGYCV